MYKLPVIFCLIALTSAKIIKLPTENKSQASQENVNADNNILWTLSLNQDDLDFQKLFVANREEEKVFKNIIAPAIKNYNTRNSHIVKKDDPLKVLSEEDRLYDSETDIKKGNLKNIKNKIKVLLNKFFVTHINDQEPFLTENLKNQPQIKIYFKGPYTSLILTSGKTRYQYFVNPPSPLPSWFYEKHILENGKIYVDIPKELQFDFLNNLHYLLEIYLSFPV